MSPDRRDDQAPLTTAEALALIDHAERPRAGDWTLRSALVRYAQLTPVAASAVLELVRRTDGALGRFRRDLERAAPDEPVSLASPDDDQLLRALLDVASALDRIGDLVSTWAVDRGDPPADEVDALAADAFGRLNDLDVPRETRPSRRSG